MRPSGVRLEAAERGAAAEAYDMAGEPDAVRSQRGRIKGLRKRRRSADTWASDASEKEGILAQTSADEMRSSRSSRRATSGAATGPSGCPRIPSCTPTSSTIGQSGPGWRAGWRCEGKGGRQARAGRGLGEKGGGYGGGDARVAGGGAAWRAAGRGCMGRCHGCGQAGVGGRCAAERRRSGRARPPLDGASPTC